MEKLHATDNLSASVIRGAKHNEEAHASGFYRVEHIRPRDMYRQVYAKMREEMNALTKSFFSFANKARINYLSLKMKEFEELLSVDGFHNVVTTEGKNTLLHYGFKGSAFTALNYIGLIGNSGYTGAVVGDTMASHAGWTEATSGVLALRVAPTFGNAPSGGSLATSANVVCNIVGSDTIQGCFLTFKSTAPVSPTTTPGNTSGALYSAGAFSGGSKAVANLDTLNITYTTSL